MVNSVVKGDFWTFEVPLSYIGSLLNTRPESVPKPAENVFLTFCLCKQYRVKFSRTVQEVMAKTLMLVDLDSTLPGPGSNCFDP